MTFLLVLALLALVTFLAGAVWTVTHTLVFNWSGGSGNLLTTVPLTATGENNLSFTIAASTTNQPEALALVRANIVSLYVLSDQDVTLKTNSSGTPQDTIALKANKPVVWCTDCGYLISALFAGDITTTYWTNAGATIANVNVRVLKAA